MEDDTMDDFLDDLFELDDLEEAKNKRTAALIAVYKQANEFRDGVHINVQTGTIEGKTYLYFHQLQMLCNSKDLADIRSDAARLIEIIDGLTNSPDFDEEEYNDMVFDGAHAFKDHKDRPVYVKKVVKPPKPTTVYVMLNTHTGHYKIGRSQNPKVRERTLQSQEPSVELIATYPGTYDDEKALHELFSEKRIRGEWFALDAFDLTAISRYFNN